jgi:xanthine dehydrogenase YagS FAD-binding subunit
VTPFRYVTAENEADAFRHAAIPGARLLAGGTTLVDLMKLDVEQPAVVVDISALPWTRIERLPDGTLRIGALVRNSDMAHDDRIRSMFPAVAEALLAGASGQLRNMATTGGNLLQRTRCHYFRDPASACNKRVPGSGCPAIAGENRMHAVLDTSERCIAAHPSDLCVALAAFSAVVQLRSARTERAVAFPQFFLAPDDHPERETTIAPGEVIVAVDLPPLAFSARSTYVKVRDRASYAFALASAAVALDVRGGRIRDARVALGGVATVPRRSIAAERAVVGQPARAESYRAAAEAALRGATARGQNRFKVELAKRTLARAFAQAEAVA